MHLGVIFVATLAISIVVSSTATWGLTYSTSYSELQDMSRGFVWLTTTAVSDFRQLVWELIGDLGVLVSDTLDDEYQLSRIQLNETGTQFLHSTMDLMNRAKIATIETQSLLGDILLSFGNFMHYVLDDFRDVDTEYASRLRAESASRAQVTFGTRMQDRIASLQRQARLYGLGVLDISRRAEQPLDGGGCTLLGLLCAASVEIQRTAFIGTAAGNMAFCDTMDVAYTRVVQRGAMADNITLVSWPAYVASTTSNFSSWEQSCLAGSNTSIFNATCSHGTAIEYPNCNRTCGFDPRCRPWYTIHNAAGPPRTQMSSVYNDVLTGESVVTLSYPIYSSSSDSLLAVVASDFHFSDVDTFLRDMVSSTFSQLVAVMFNSSDLIVVGTNRACSNAMQQGSGVPVLQTCHTVLQDLGLWLAQNRDLVNNATLERNGTLWDVFSGSVDSFSYFVVVGMNKSEVFAKVNATSQQAQDMLRNLSLEQSTRMANTEAAALAEMDAVSKEKIASLQAMQAVLEQSMKDAHTQAEETFNTSRQRSADRLSNLTSAEMASVFNLEDYHLSQVVRSVGPTFGAVVGIFAGILLLGAYGTMSVTKQVQQIAQVMEDVALMRVEERQVSQKSWVKEVQRIEVALGILVQRLAEYKSYMPAGLFQCTELSADGSCPSPTAASQAPAEKQKRTRGGGSSVGSRSSSSLANVIHVTPVASYGTRLLRRSVAVMAVNVIHFQKEATQRSAAILEALLNRLISTVHCVASKAQGNIDAVVGDQLLVTFNAHITCSDPPTAASNAALELMGSLKEVTAPRRVQIGLAAGTLHAGHLGYAPFKAMVALGAPMKVASLLAHLSGFEESAVLMCPAMEERVKYHFRLQPVDLLALPRLGAHVALYDKSVNVFIMEGAASTSPGAQEWLYEVGAREPLGQWATTFAQLVKADSAEAAKDCLTAYLRQHPEDRLAQRLLRRLVNWIPQLGIQLAERPDLL